MNQQQLPVVQQHVMDKQTYASPMSYIGSTRRILAWAHRERTSLPAAAVWTVAITGVVGAFMLVSVWYMLTFGLLWVVMVPWRLHRRGQRKALQLQQVQLATMQAMAYQQAQATAQLQQIQASAPVQIEHGETR